jgi:catechol 2,3-dioxygenase-like lactoylglutathione lyase family enzyme
MNNEPKIKGINHITFICEDLEKSARMFQFVFDAKEVYSSGEKTFSISKEKFFKIGDLWIAIMEGKPIEKTYNHIAFKVDENDLPLLEERIQKLNLTILQGRERKKEEGASLYFYDYDNHLFEFHTGNLDTRLKFYNDKN